MARVDAADPAPGVPVVRTVATLLLLSAALPLNLAVTAVALLRSALTASPARPAPDARGPRTILVSGGKMTKALALARAFDRAGHRVILVESEKYRLTGHRFSRAVDRFYTVPGPQDEGYADALVAIVQREHVDVYVPVCSPAAAWYDAQAMAVLSEHCTVLHFDPDTLHRLDDKYAFSSASSSAGLSVPECHRITDPQQVVDFDFAGHGKTYVLKSIPYDPVRRLDLTPLPRPTRAQTAAFARSLPISEDQPWIMQEFIVGQEYCTHSTVRDGEVQLHCCCESSPFQLNYEMVDKPEITVWVTGFVRALGLTGQVSLDFIQAHDGTVYAIECNPRTHSAITMFYNHPGVARAYLERDVPTVTPRRDSRPTYWLYHELWRVATRPARLPGALRTIARGTDAIFDWSDPLPFLMVHHAQIPSLLLDNLRHGRAWIRIDFNIGKLVEPAGISFVLRVLHLVGSAVSDFFCDLSRLYAAGCLEATDDPARYEVHLAYVTPDRRWRFPDDLGAGAIGRARSLSVAEAVTQLVSLEIDVMVPQMFCMPGMTHYRALFDVLGIPYVGNRPEVMALTGHKARAKAVVAAAGISVPRGEVLRRGAPPSLAPPVVIKPVDGDNSVGVGLVHARADYPAALQAAFTHGDEVLVESFVPLGREVRCGIVVRDGELVGLPLEEYRVDPERHPIRDYDDKIRRSDDGSLALVAKERTRAWIVDPDDPLTAAVWDVAARCHRALGCRHYSLFDFRIDPAGRPWFLEAGLYCSFAPDSVICAMARAAGIATDELFRRAVTDAAGRG